MQPRNRNVLISVQHEQRTLLFALRGRAMLPPAICERLIAHAHHLGLPIPYADIVQNAWLHQPEATQSIPLQQH